MTVWTASFDSPELLAREMAQLIRETLKSAVATFATEQHNLMTGSFARLAADRKKLADLRSSMPRSEQRRFVDEYIADMRNILVVTDQADFHEAFDHDERSAAALRTLREAIASAVTFSEDYERGVLDLGAGI